MCKKILRERKKQNQKTRENRKTKQIKKQIGDIINENNEKKIQKKTENIEKKKK